MNKRGEVATETTQQAFMTMLYVLIAILLFAIFYSAKQILTQRLLTAPMRDLDRTIDAIKDFLLPQKTPDRELQVFTTSRKPYIVQLLGPGNSQPTCGKKACLCVQEEGKAVDCKILAKVTENCDEKLCVPSSQEEIVQVKPGQPITICRENNELHIGASCA